MSESEIQHLILTFIPPFTSGIFLLISGILQARLKNVAIQSTAIPPTTKVSHFVSLGRVLLHAGIVLLVSTTAFFVVSVTTTYLGVPHDVSSSHFYLFKWTPFVLAFMWVAAKVDRVIRWKHLTSVALVVFIVQILIYFMFITTRSILLKGVGPPMTLNDEIFFISYILVQVFVSMGIGGALTNAMKPH